MSPLPIWRYVNLYVHLRNSNKQHLILAKLRISSALSIDNQRVKFQLSRATQTIATAAFVRLPQNRRRRSFATVCLILTVSTACSEIPR